MSKSERRDAEYRQHLDLEHQRRSTVSHKDAGQAPSQYENGGANGYVKLAMGVAFLPISFIFGFGLWFLIPAAILIALGLRDLKSQRYQSLPAAEDDKEKELLSAIRDNDYSITPAVAALETSLTVRKADGMLSDLANGGHLQLDSRDGVLYYSLPGKRAELGP
jgi:hypothetical protein